jgi:histidine triad (HIT) family protein
MDAEVIHQDDRVVAFRDIHRQAPVHVLIIPRTHITSMLDIEPGETELLGGRSMGWPPWPGN